MIEKVVFNFIVWKKKKKIKKKEYFETKFLSDFTETLSRLSNAVFRVKKQKIQSVGNSFSLSIFTSSTLSFSV